MELQKLLKNVEEFQVASGQPVNMSPVLCVPDDYVLRYNLMKEENEEYLESSEAMDVVEVLDACVDQLYILLGTVNQHGMQHVFEEAFNRVHANNMTKVGADGKVIRNEYGKILKPEGFVPVDLSDLVEYK